VPFIVHMLGDLTEKTAFQLMLEIHFCAWVLWTNSFGVRFAPKAPPKQKPVLSDGLLFWWAQRPKCGTLCDLVLSYYMTT